MSNPITEVILVRHGETHWNTEGRIQGHLNIPLNAAGLAQAAALGTRLRGERIRAIYSSDLERAYRTAQLIAESDGFTIQSDPRLRERHLGILQGLTRQEAAESQPLAWKMFKNRDPDASLEGGEDLRGFSQRVTNLLSEFCERHRGERVLLVTHGGVLDAAYRHAANLALEEPRNFPIHNASLNLLRHQNLTWRIERWGDVDHLNDIPLCEGLAP